MRSVARMFVPSASMEITATFFSVFGYSGNFVAAKAETFS
jgi:hypothetical protein